MPCLYHYSLGARQVRCFGRKPGQKFGQMHLKSPKQSLFNKGFTAYINDVSL